MSPLPLGWGTSVPVATRLDTDHRGKSGRLCDCDANPRVRGNHPATWSVASWSARVVTDEYDCPLYVQLGARHERAVCLNRLLQINTDSRWPGQVLGIPEWAYGGQSE